MQNVIAFLKVKHFLNHRDTINQNWYFFFTITRDGWLITHLVINQMSYWYLDFVPTNRSMKSWGQKRLVKLNFKKTIEWNQKLAQENLLIHFILEISWMFVACQKLQIRENNVFGFLLSSRQISKPN